MPVDITLTGTTDDGWPYTFRFTLAGSAIEIDRGGTTYQDARSFDLHGKLPIQREELNRYLNAYASKIESGQLLRGPAPRKNLRG